MSFSSWLNDARRLGDEVSKAMSGWSMAPT